MTQQGKKQTNEQKVEKVRQYLLRLIQDEYNHYLSIIPADTVNKHAMENFWNKIRRNIEQAIRQYNETNSDSLHIQDYNMHTADVKDDQAGGQYIDINLYSYETEINLDGAIELKYTCSVGSCKNDLKNEKYYEITMDNIEYDLCNECYGHIKKFLQEKMQPGRKKQVAEQQWERFKKEQLHNMKRGPSLLLNLDNNSRDIINQELDRIQVREDDLNTFFETPIELPREDDT